LIGQALAHRLAGFERWARILQGVAGAAIIAVAALAIAATI
jgi:hypothetical protein